MTTILAALLLLQPAPILDKAYETVDGKDVTFDFYPAPGAEHAPLVVMIHGGAWTGGDKKEMAPFAPYFTKEGISAVTINYRLGPKSKWPAMIDDCRAAVTFFKSHADEYHIDSTRIAATGASAGGHLALLLGTGGGPGDGAPAKVKAVLDFFGPTDLSQDYPKPLANMVAMQVVGKKFEDLGEIVKEFSPVNYVTPDTAPIFIIHGKADTLVLPKQSERLIEKLEAAKVEHQVRWIEGMKHEFKISDPSFVQAVADGIQFIKAKLTQTL